MNLVNSDWPSSQDFLQCAPGSYSVPWSASCVQCPVGKYLANASGETEEASCAAVSYIYIFMCAAASYIYIYIYIYMLCTEGAKSEGAHSPMLFTNVWPWKNGLALCWLYWVNYCWMGIFGKCWLKELLSARSVFFHSCSWLARMLYL